MLYTEAMIIVNVIVITIVIVFGESALLLAALKRATGSRTQHGKLYVPVSDIAEDNAHCSNDPPLEIFGLVADVMNLDFQE